ncbi:YceI family protein [Sciscionella marina]|uniref:YceI family protein n=1 Tax=Sciscionella marina TaxID=508770 RepID=UPI00037B2473|nr:YceI family protein [Sciscionella marina]
MTTGTSGPVEVPPPGRYRIDGDRSTIRFHTRHMFGIAPVRGRFGIETGHIEVADPVHRSSVRVRVPATSFRTGNGMRDPVVHGKQYLDAAQHPVIAFGADRIAEESEGWMLYGSLTVRETTAPLELRIEECRTENARLLVRARGTVDRYALGITAMKGMTGRYLTALLEVSAEPESAGNG